MKTARISMKSLAMGGCAFGALIAAAAPAAGAEFAVAPQELQPALQQFASQGDQQVLFSSTAVAGKSTAGFTGEASPEDALQRLLSGTDLVWSKTADGALLVMTQAEAQSRRPQLSQTAEGGGGATVEALIVTAQKREEDIQDVPIAISAFSQEDLTRSQIAGGPDLMTQVPNFTFTKTNFSSYSIQIRGIGTQAISATVDPAVAVAFNNTPFITNRFFEQEFYDLERVEVLRGPQGTLYGRNATAGVVNIISAKPKFYYESKLSGDISNYSSSRLEGMVNIPLVEDRIALRLAGAWTKRDGYVTNALQGEPTDGRDLWSVRATIGFEPTDNLRAWLTYEHFEEDDDRLRSGKQLCTRHDFPEALEPLLEGESGGAFGDKTYFSQGCQMGSLYDAEAFQVPNGFALPFFGPLANLGLAINSGADPYASTVQSRDLRVIETHVDPIYKAKSDILHLSFEYDLTDGLTLSSETAYGVDELFSFNDYNRFNTTPGVFNPNEQFAGDEGIRRTYLERGLLDEDGVFCDPQLGCSSRLVAADLSTASSDQFSQEFRLSSDFDGPFNFHLGANYLHYDTTNKYYVFINTLSLFGAAWCEPVPTPQDPWDPTDTEEDCIRHLAQVDPNNPILPEDWSGIYIDRNPIGSLNDFGRNYFLSKNPFRLASYALFGEMAYELTPELKLTAGLRYTVDEKDAPIIPTWLLVSHTYGQPTQEIISQDWREPTGRLVLDWQPETGFTDETLVYGSYAHGYKAGGVNPPLPGSLPFAVTDGSEIDRSLAFIRLTHPLTFGPEFIDAFELGTKNTLLDGRVTFNLATFYYDYEGYQISQIVNRSAVNRNFDTEVWGAELEADWRPLDNLRLGFRGGYQNTKVGDGQSMIDTIDRTAGNPDYFVLKPWPTVPSNCIAPLDLVLEFGRFFSCEAYYTPDIDPLTQLPYVPDPTVRRGLNGGPPVPLSAALEDYPGFHPGSMPGGGSGIAKDVSGNELPNAPNFTTTVTVDYTLPLAGDWLLTLHGDYYRQSEAWTRIFNEDPYDKLRPFSQINLAAILTNEEAGWNIMAYIKNVEDKDNITGAFLNSDDSGLTTNIFLNEPRLYGLRVTKAWTGSLFGAVDDSEKTPHTGPYHFEISGGISRLAFEAENETFAPFWADDWNPVHFPLPLWVQNDGLDAGDGRELALTYRPAKGSWTASVGARFGRTNGGTAANYTETDLPQIPWLTQAILDLGIGQKYETPRFPSFASVRADNREEHTLVDFEVGRDFDMGGWGEGNLALGLRYAQFKSRTDVIMDGQPYRSDPQYAVGGNHVSDVVEADFAARRDFEGAGPSLAWKGSAPILGDDRAGHVLFDWSVSGGALFGTRKADVAYTAASRHFEWPAAGITPLDPGGDSPQSESLDAASYSRSDDVIVPFAGAALGLSYKLDRVRVSAGYRYETYFDAIDGGVDEARGEDRTIQGPYLRFAVGFGG